MKDNNRKIEIDYDSFNRIIHNISRVAEELRKEKKIELAKEVNAIREDFLSNLIQEE